MWPLTIQFANDDEAAEQLDWNFVRSGHHILAYFSHELDKHAFYSQKHPSRVPQNWLCEKGSSPVPNTAVKKLRKRVS